MFTYGVPKDVPRDYNKYESLPQAPTIIFIDPGWIELKCYICGGNGSQQSGTVRLAKGIKGIKAHIAHAHPEKSRTCPTAELARLCQVREVPIKEVEHIEAWDHSYLPINTYPFSTEVLSNATQTQDPDDTPEQEVADVQTPVNRSEVTTDASLLLPACIVQDKDGVYIELRCPQCSRNSHLKPGRNGEKKHPVFFGGIAGFRSHLRYSHGFQSQGPQHTREYCRFRTFTQAEIDLIKSNAPDAPESMFGILTPFRLLN